MQHTMRTKFMYRNDTYLVSSQEKNVYTGKKENGRKIVTVTIDPFNGQALAV